MDLLDQDNIAAALSKVLKKGLSFDLELYDRIFLTKKCAEVINRELVPQGYSVTVVDSVSMDVYYIKMSKRLLTFDITEKGISFPKNTKREQLAAASPVITVLMTTLMDLTEN
tara:strand:+ start:25 stop:363 length:339 start_codon:yes stop_codon:yes gene_type:complete